MQHVKLANWRPRLREGLEVVKIAETRVLFRSFTGTVMLSGDFVNSVLPSMLSRLDGSRSVDELRAESDGFHAELEHFLQLMDEKGFLEPAVDDEVLPAGSANERAYWSLQAGSANEGVRRLCQSSVAIFGMGAIGTNLARALAQSGVGKLSLFARPFEASDAVSADTPDRASDSPSAALVAELQKHGTEIVTAPLFPAEQTTLSEAVRNAHVAVLCGDTMSLAGYEALNRACIESKVRWTSARIDRYSAIIGPFIIPRQTACFTCFELRSRANADYPADHEALHRHWKAADPQPQAWPSLAPFTDVVANLLAIDLLRVLGGQHMSAATGRIIRFDLHTLGSRPHEILKLPRCPSCSRLDSHPLTRIWDIAPSRSSTADEEHK